MCIFDWLTYQEGRTDWLTDLFGCLQTRSVAGVIPLLPQENIELASQLKKLESSFSIFAEESNPNQLLAHLGRMAVEFHHLSSKVQKNEQRTSLLQVRSSRRIDGDGGSLVSFFSSIISCGRFQRLTIIQKSQLFSLWWRVGTFKSLLLKAHVLYFHFRLYVLVFRWKIQYYDLFWDIVFVQDPEQ